MLQLPQSSGTSHFQQSSFPVLDLSTLQSFQNQGLEQAMVEPEVQVGFNLTVILITCHRCHILEGWITGKKW